MLVLALAFLQNSAFAQVTCIQNYLASRNHDSLGFAPSDVEELVNQVAASIGLDPVGISVIPCEGGDQVSSNYFDRKEIPKGEYIVYDPVWVRQVVGNKLSASTQSKAHDEAIVLFGHELGHLLQRHWTVNSGLPRLTKETEADHFAGCAAGALGVKWEAVEDFLGRIRGDVDTTYPSREHSVAAAKDGFDHCQRAPVKPLSPGVFDRKFPIIDVRYDLTSQSSYWSILGQSKVEVIQSGTAKPVLTVDYCGKHSLSPTAVAVVSFHAPIAAISCPEALRLVNINTGEAAELGTGELSSQITWNANLIDVGEYVVSKHIGAPCLFEWYVDWDNIQSSKFVRKIECNSIVTSFSATRSYWLAVGTQDGMLRIYNEYNGSVNYEHRFDEKYSESYQKNSIEGVQFWRSENNNSGLKIAFHTWGNVAYVIDMPDMVTHNIHRFVYQVDREVIFASKLSHSGKFLALGTSDGAVTIWDVNSGELKGQYFHDAAVRDLKFNWADDVVVSCGEDGAVRTFRLSTKQAVDVLQLQGVLVSLDLKSDRVIVGQGSKGNQDPPPFVVGEWKLSRSGKISPL
jgi:WD40 repeat protein